MCAVCLPSVVDKVGLELGDGFLARQGTVWTGLWIGTTRGTGENLALDHGEGQVPKGSGQRV